jgi:hypothetical protein
LVGKPEGKRPHGKPRHRWQDNVETDLKEIELRGVNWIHQHPELLGFWTLSVIWFSKN